MPIYEVTAFKKLLCVIEVEADSEQEAKDIALDSDDWDESDEYDDELEILSVEAKEKDNE